jgi:hypothetical protein
MVATDNSMLNKETNVIHDNGATISLMDKGIADAIGLRGETRPLGLSTIGDPNVVQQAFKAQINLHDSEGKEIGKPRCFIFREPNSGRLVSPSGPVSPFGLHKFPEAVHWR